VGRDLLENSARHRGAALYQIAPAALAGVLVVVLAPGAPPPAVVTFALWFGMATLALQRHSPVWVMAACAVLGFALTAAHANTYLEKRWPDARDGERILAEVIVDTIPVSHGDAWSFDAGGYRVISRDMNVRPRAGERWRLVLALRSPRARLNPGALDMEQQYFRARIHAMASVVTSRLNRRIDAGHRPLTQLREAAAGRIERRIDDRDASALIQALAVGATGSMSPQQWQVFNATGTSHLVAISGLHVTLFATVAFFLSRRLWSAALWRFTVWPRDSVAALIALTASFGYALLAGLSVPTQRTLIMLAAWLLARSMARVGTIFGPLWIALVAVLVLDPFAPLAAGFWLSFAAMAAIIVATEPRIVRRGLLHAMSSVQVALTVALAPLSMAWFGSISAVGVLANAVAIPAVSWIFVPTILVALLLMPAWPAASDAALDFAARLHEHGWSWLVAASELPSAVLRLHPPVWWYPLAAMGVGVALMPLPLRVRLAAVLWLVPLAGADPKEIPEAGFEISVLDVGRGTAVLVRTAEHSLLFGTGEVYGTDGRTVENIVLPFLRHEGVGQIDGLVVPRPHGPEGAGVTVLLAELPVVRIAAAEASWSWNGVRFDLRQASALSITSAAGEAFLQEHLFATAKWAVVSGRRPASGREPPALRRWLPAGARLFATHESGAIRVRFDPASGPGEPDAMRAASPKLWRLPP
jgi:competence protein ComEC